MALFAITLVFLTSIGVGLAATYASLSAVLFLMERSVVATPKRDTAGQS
jgi:hypothetical protein